MKNYPKPQRVSDCLVKDMKIISIERIKKGLANPLNKNEISLREMTELLTKTDGYKYAIEKELKFKPKKK